MAKKGSDKGRDKKDRRREGPEGGSGEPRGLAKPPIPGRPPLRELNLNPLNETIAPDPSTGRFGPAFQQRGESGPGPGNESDPTRRSGIGFLDAADESFQQPQTPQDITPPTERTGPGFNPPNDELNPRLLFPVKPPEEEEPQTIPGDPDDLGERARRRRSRDDGNASPVLRRGLLGV